jgi:hypothetical protein
MPETTTADGSDSCIGALSSLTFQGREYATSDIDAGLRERFNAALCEQVESLDGVEAALTAGWDGSGYKQSVRLEVPLTTRRTAAGDEVTANLRSLSQRLRQTLSDPAFVSDAEVVHTPTALNADAGLYEDPFYIVEVWFV